MFFTREKFLVLYLLSIPTNIVCYELLFLLFFEYFHSKRFRANQAAVQHLRKVFLNWNYTLPTATPLKGYFIFYHFSFLLFYLCPRFRYCISLLYSLSLFVFFPPMCSSCDNIFPHHFFSIFVIWCFIYKQQPLVSSFTMLSTVVSSLQYHNTAMWWGHSRVWLTVHFSCAPWSGFSRMYISISLPSTPLHATI